MRTSEENIRQLLEMLDNPDAFTEQEIQDIVNRDEATRETYRLMVEARRSSRHRHDDKPIDVDAAWQRFVKSEELRVKSEELRDESEELRVKSEELRDESEELRVKNVLPQYNPQTTPHSSLFTLNSSLFTLQSPLQKVAASIVGVLLVSGIAFAAIHIANQLHRQEAPRAEVAEGATPSATPAPADTLASDGATMQPVVYNNIPLEKMLPEIAAHYGVTVAFGSDEVRGLRFRFVWNPRQGLDQVVSDLNRFERLRATLKDKVVTVE